MYSIDAFAVITMLHWLRTNFVLKRTIFLYLMPFAFIVVDDVQLSSQVNIWASVTSKEGGWKSERSCLTAGLGCGLVQSPGSKSYVFF